MRWRQTATQHPPDRIIDVIALAPRRLLIQKDRAPVNRQRLSELMLSCDLGV
jgi:hypothetical protein